MNVTNKAINGHFSTGLFLGTITAVRHFLSNDRQNPMIQHNNRMKIAVLMLLFIVLAACANQSSSGAPAAIAAYFESLVVKDVNQLVNVSCSAWEANARDELRTFDAVAITLQDLKCLESGQDGETTLVSCTGKIVANYGNEVLEINLADRDYQAVKEGGEWRMCGYR
jgi:hypothetical protein